MQRQLSNVATFHFTHQEREVEPGEREETPAQSRPAPPSPAIMKTQNLNYSTEDISALASQAELLVLRGSSHDLSHLGDTASEGESEEDSGEETAREEGGVGEKWPGRETDQQEESSLSGTWEHDLQVCKVFFVMCIFLAQYYRSNT